MASVVKKMECYNIRKSVKDLGEDLKEKIKAERVCDDYKRIVKRKVYGHSEKSACTLCC